MLTVEGTFLDKWGTLGSGPGQFGLDGPTDVAVSGSGEIYVVDRANCRVEKFMDLPVLRVPETLATSIPETLAT